MSDDGKEDERRSGRRGPEEKTRARGVDQAKAVGGAEVHKKAEEEAKAVGSEHQKTDGQRGEEKGENEQTLCEKAGANSHLGVGGESRR